MPEASSTPPIVEEMELLRAFVALELPQEVKVELGRIQTALNRAGRHFVRWVSPQNIHLSLKFLGTVPTDVVSDIAKAMEDASTDIGPFLLKTGRLGAFPNTQRPRVGWVEVTGDVDSLIQLQLRVDSDLAHLGFAKETRPFTPHLTLARLRDNASPDERHDFGQEMMRHTSMRRSFMVDELSLMKSTLTPTGAIYDRLFLTPLTQ